MNTIIVIILSAFSFLAMAHDNHDDDLDIPMIEKERPSYLKCEVLDSTMGRN